MQLFQMGAGTVILMHVIFLMWTAAGLDASPECLGDIPAGLAWMCGSPLDAVFSTINDGVSILTLIRGGFG